MLSDTSRPVVEATLPVVGEHIGEIAQRFYAHMFQARPDLLDGLFNRGNQAGGQQQQALAGSVAAFASSLVSRPDELPDQLLSRISHKHVSLGLRPDRYRIVHEHLMWAIVDVLGDAVTPEVAAAWDEVYWLMANVLINQERTLYASAGLDPDTVWRTWRVTERVRETDDVVTFVVEPADDRPAEPSLPGQYVSLKALMPDGVHQPRQYSLTRADDGRYRRFSVKRVHDQPTPDGEVSNLLHARVEVGDEVVLSAPFGDVVLSSTGRPVVFASAGIGITPMAGMISHLAQAASPRSVTLLHADASPATFALQEQVRADLASLPDATLHTWFRNAATTADNVAADEAGSAAATTADEVAAVTTTDAAAVATTAAASGRGSTFTGLLDVSSLGLPADAEYYLCGSLAFMQSVRSGLIARGVPAQDIQYEVFGPDLWLADFQ